MCHKIVSQQLSHVTVPNPKKGKYFGPVSPFFLSLRHVVVVHQGTCWEEVALHRQRPGSRMSQRR